MSRARICCSRLMGDFFYEHEGDEKTRKLAWDWTSGTWAKVVALRRADHRLDDPLAVFAVVAGG